MPILKLTTAMSYRGHGLVATKAQPYVTTDAETAEALLETGLFEETDEVKHVTQQAPTGTIEAIDTMGVTKLREYAKKHNLGLEWPKGTDAETIRADIRAAMKPEPPADPGAQQAPTGEDGENPDPFQGEE